MHEQTPLKETYESGQSPKWGVTADATDAPASDVPTSPAVEAAPRSSLGSLKRSFEEQEEVSIKKRRELSDADTLIEADGQIHEIIPKETESDLDVIDVRSITSGEAASSI